MPDGPPTTVGVGDKGVGGSAGEEMTVVNAVETRGEVGCVVHG